MRQRGVVASTWPLEGVAANFPMALDEAGHRLFVAARRPSRLPAYDTESGQRVDELEICGDADDLFFDRRRQQLCAVCGEGRFDAAQQRDADCRFVMERVQTSRGARTGRCVPGLSTSRAPLDAMLREIAAAGLFVSTHPDGILKLGTKDVLVDTRALG